MANPHRVGELHRAWSRHFHRLGRGHDEPARLAVPALALGLHRSELVGLVQLGLQALQPPRRRPVSRRLGQTPRADGHHRVAPLGTRARTGSGAWPGAGARTWAGSWAGARTRTRTGPWSRPWSGTR